MVIFISGIYGTGKSYTLNKACINQGLKIFDCSELIKKINKEDYSYDKSVKDKEYNQRILIEQVKELQQEFDKIILTGHFCIFGSELQIIDLPDFVYKDLNIIKIINLEADTKSVIKNLKNRDDRNYSSEIINNIKVREKSRAIQISKELNVDFENINLIYKNEDYDRLRNSILKGVNVL